MASSRKYGAIRTPTEKQPLRTVFSCEIRTIRKNTAIIQMPVAPAFFTICREIRFDTTPQSLESFTTREGPYRISPFPRGIQKYGWVVLVNGKGRS